MPAGPLIGHAPQLAQLKRDLETGNLAHAYLFVGPPHIGKFTVAKWFAKQLMTKGMSVDHKEEVERQIDLLIHPDVLVMDKLWMEEVLEDMDDIGRSSNVPQQQRIKAKIKTDTITIDDVRIIHERLHETGTSQHRVSLIRSIERMRDEAANALLKMLEEPPPGRIFLLTAQSTDHVLPTVLSRARVLHFNRVGDQDMRQLLDGSSDDDARFILHIAQGAPGFALALKNDPDRLRQERQVHTQARDVWTSSSLATRLTLLHPVTERGGEAENFLKHLGLTLRELPDRSRKQERSLQQMVEDLETNAHRELIVQRFAMAIHEGK